MNNSLVAPQDPYAQTRSDTRLRSPKKEPQTPFKELELPVHAAQKGFSKEYTLN